MQWKHVNSPPPRKFHTQRRLESYDHNFLGLQRRATGGLHTKEDGNNWTLLYDEMLTNLRHAVKEKRRGMLARGQWRRSEFFLEGRNFLALTRPALTHYNLHRHKTLTSATDIITFIP